MIQNLASDDPVMDSEVPVERERQLVLLGAHPALRHVRQHDRIMVARDVSASTMA